VTGEYRETRGEGYRSSGRYVNRKSGCQGRLGLERRLLLRWPATGGAISIIDSDLPRQVQDPERYSWPMSLIRRPWNLDSLTCPQTCPWASGTGPNPPQTSQRRNRKPLDKSATYRGVLICLKVPQADALSKLSYGHGCNSGTTLKPGLILHRDAAAVQSPS